MGECTGNEMEVEELPLLEFPRRTKADHSNPGNNGSLFEIRTQFNSLSVNYSFSRPFPHTVCNKRNAVQSGTAMDEHKFPRSCCCLRYRQH